VVPRDEHPECAAHEPRPDGHRRLVWIAARREGGTRARDNRALEVAWRDADAVYLSFDIDSVDAGFVPGTGSPEPGGLLPREALKLLRLIAREGLCGMEVVEVAPPYDVSDMTAQLACRAVMDVLGTLVGEEKLGRRKREPARGEEPPPAPA